MKLITLSMVDSSNIEIKDDDNTDIKEYSQELSSVLKSGNITILETSSGTLILRPNKISSILVKEEISESIPKEPIKEDDTHVDIISDG